LPDACIALARRAELVLHTGDVTTRGVLAELEALGPPVRAVRGNVDEPALQAELPERLVLTWEGIRIGMIHDAGRPAGRHARLLERFPECEVVAYGHTHAAEVTRVGETWVVNPGSPTERRRAPFRTMAMIEEGRPRLVTLS
jgi:putative phosphoesterase